MINLHCQHDWIWNHLGDTGLGVICKGVSRQDQLRMEYLPECGTRHPRAGSLARIKTREMRKSAGHQPSSLVPD